MPRDAREVAALGMGRSLESVVSGGSMKSGFSLGSLTAMPGFGIGKRRAKKDKGKDKHGDAMPVEGGAPSISEASLASTETGDEGDMTGRESEEEFGTFGGRGEGLGRRTSVEEGW